MKIIDKHLLREHLVPLAYCLTAFLLMFVVIDIFGNLTKFLKFETSAGEIALYYGYLAISIVEIISPASLLLATLYTLARLSRHNEITAMRASGIGLTRIMVPFLWVGLTFTIGTLVINEFVVPQALRYTSEFFARKKNPQVDPNIHHHLAYLDCDGGWLWSVENVDLRSPHIMHRVVVTDQPADSEFKESITASRAEWLDGTWWFYDYVSEVLDSEDSVVSRSRDVTRPIERREIRTPPREIVNGSVKQRELLNSWELYTYIKSRDCPSAGSLAEPWTMLHRRLAMPWACLVVVIFAIPAGARSARSGAVLGTTLALIAFFGFYALIQIGTIIGSRGWVAPWIGAWLANVTFTLLGAVMINRLK